MNKKYIMPLALAIILLTLINGPITFAVDTNDTVTVNINISAVGTIVVSPNVINWTLLQPGSNGASEYIIIKNTGSVNVSGIYMTTDTITVESTNPLPTADVTAYSAAGLIFVKNSTDSAHSHAGRLEWNLSSILTGEELNINENTNAFAHGWYRNSTGNEYLWKVENGTDGVCNNTGTIFQISSIPENDTTLNRDITVGASTCTTVTPGTTWGTFTCSTGPLVGYCIATANTCDKIYLYKYDMSSQFPNCDNSGSLITDNLIPGSEDAISIYASVPNGIPYGDTTSGTLTIVASY
ncbi:MAG: hypothetical protein K0B07_00060 [DPANN group archaeon]|nr:hypothetical protein [DPANN group archaeon]